MVRIAPFFLLVGVILRSSLGVAGFAPYWPEGSAAVFDPLPWPRTVSGQGFSTTESRAQVQARTNLKWHIDNERRRCESSHGQFTFREESARCSKAALYRCDVIAICYCLAGESDGLDQKDSYDANPIGANTWVSPVLSDRLDCQAIALKNPGLCRGQDCRAILYHALNYCRSSDCRAIVRGLSSLCQTRDCRALVTNNLSFCESSNCRAVIYGNPGLCRYDGAVHK